jgi:hypothetical protein
MSIAWPEISHFAGTISLPAGYRFERMARADVPLVCSAMKQWYPDIVVGSESVFLQESFYFEQVALAGESNERDIYALLVKKDDAVVALGAVEYDERARVLHGRLVAIAPSHRATGLGESIGAAISDPLGRSVGAELLLSYATLKHPFSQLLLERLGYRLVGIVPGHDRDQIRPGVVKRVYEALYAKLLVDEDSIEFPAKESLLGPASALLALVARR